MGKLKEFAQDMADIFSDGLITEKSNRYGQVMLLMRCAKYTRRLRRKKMTTSLEVRKLLERANESLDVAYKSIRLVISDLGDLSVSDNLKTILAGIDRQKQEIERLLYPAVSDVEVFRYESEGKVVMLSEANHK